MTIILDHIGKKYNGKDIFSDVYCEIEDGRCYVVVGPEGSGKSTLLNIFMEKEKPDSGKLCKMGDYKYPTLHSAYLPQNSELNLKKDAIWNVKRAHRWASKTSAIKELSKFITEEKMNIPVAELSDGERKLVEIVKTFFVTADFIVLDEPLVGLNEDEKKKALDYILKMQGSRPLLIASRDETDFSFARIIRLKVQ